MKTSLKNCIRKRKKRTIHAGVSNDFKLPIINMLKKTKRIKKVDEEGFIRIEILSFK